VLASSSERSGLAGTLGSAVQAAQRHHPVSTAEVQLLHPIPVNARAPRRMRGNTEAITSLCQGTGHSAERVRHAATKPAACLVSAAGIAADQSVNPGAG
jgi:hypothetical protein